MHGLVLKSESHATPQGAIRAEIAVNAVGVGEKSLKIEFAIAF
jgi:hypothetical protein